MNATVDEGQIQQVLTNIMMNAIQSISSGGEVQVVVGTRVASPPDELAPGRQCAFIEIRDNGGGISSQEREQIFEPFFTTKDEGTGLGLSIAYGIIQEHGGWVEVESEPGCGSCFTIYLPKESL